MKGAIKNVLSIVTCGRIGPLGNTAPHVKRPTKTEGDLDSYLPPEHVTAGDWADAIFGVVPNQSTPSSSSFGLRGRVSFSAFVEITCKKPASAVRFFPGSPKAGYVANYRDLDSHGSKSGIRGWKHYKVRPDGFAVDVPTSDHKSATEITPMPAGCCFVGNLVIHNLRPAEFGALLWCFLWGGASEDEKLSPHPSRRHLIGMNKPYGYGSCHFEVESARLQTWSQNRLVNYDKVQSPALMTNSILAFESSMQQAFSKRGFATWLDRPAMDELLDLADAAKQPSDPQWLKYPKLDTKSSPKVNWFRDFKERGYKLRRFTEVLAGTLPATSSFPDEEITKQCRTLADLRVGEVLEGTVKAQGRRSDFAFIDFNFKGNNQDGFLHISQVSNPQPENFEAAVPSNSRIRVCIIKVESHPKGGVRVQCSMIGVDQSGL